MTTRWPILLLLTALPALAEVVRFETADGVEIVADFHRARTGDAPTVVCIPMYGHTRRTYEPLLRPLLDKGMNVLVLDKRGHGESTPRLASRVKERDAALFRAMHLDVEAAIDHLETALGCDATRIGLVGASVGCSVAVDATVRHPELVRAVVLLTPGSRYLGVPTLEHLERWPGTRVFTFTAQDEERKSREVMDALAAHAGSNHLVVPGRRIHGTRMFGEVNAIEDLIANFMESSLVRSVDLRVPRLEEGAAHPGGSSAQRGDSAVPAPPAGVPRPRRRIGGTTYSLMVYAVGTRWVLGAVVDGAFKGRLRFDVGSETILFPFDSSREAPAPVEAVGGKATGEQSAADGLRWISFSVDRSEDTLPLALEFRPSRGGPVRLPGGGVSFAAIRPPKPPK